MEQGALTLAIIGLAVIAAFLIYVVIQDIRSGKYVNLDHLK